MDTESGLKGKPVKNVATYHNSIMALHNNNTPVRLIATGDAEGASPVEKAISPDGKIFWDSSSNFRIIDSNCLPYGKEGLDFFAGRQGGRE